MSGYLARRAAGAGAIAIVPCDNLPDNGPALKRVVDDFISAVDPSLADWAAANVAFGTTMVDRITPATTDEHRAAVLAALGVVDASPVPTEPFSEWVIAGEFPKGRPAWDAAGAFVVDDVVPFEQRKLWLLNGSHSLLAYAGTILGHETVADAIADPVARGWVEQWWDEASSHLTLPAEDVARPTVRRCSTGSRTRTSATRWRRSPLTAPRRSPCGSCRPCAPSARPDVCRRAPPGRSRPGPATCVAWALP